MCLRHFYRAATTSAVHMAVVRMAEVRTPQVPLTATGHCRFFDEGEEYEVMRVGRKRWTKSAIDVAFYCVPDQRGDEPEWE